MKRSVALITAFVLLLTCFCAVACNRSVYVYLHGYDGGEEVKKIVYDSDVALPEPKCDDYVFEGWFTDANTTEPFVQGQEKSEDFHLYAKWSKAKSPVVHTVRLVFNDGRADVTLNVADGIPASVPQPDREGYRFDGWYFDGSDTQYADQPVTEDIVLCAKWTELSRYIVKLVYNDGETFVDIPIYDGGYVQLPTPSREGYLFKGWFTDQTYQHKFTDTPVKSNITLYAGWSAQTGNAYNVTFVFYGNVRTVKTFEAGSVAEVPSPPIRRGYIFEGWYLDENFTVECNDLIVDHDYTVYAKWYAKIAITLKYMDGVTSDRVIYVNEGETPELPADPVRLDHDFVGWFLDEEGAEQYVLGPATHDLTLFAKWEEKHTVHRYDSYFMFTECTYSGCHVLGRNRGERQYDNMCDFGWSKQNEIDGHYDDCQSALNGTVAQFVEAFEIFEDDLEYLSDQYYWATLYYDVRYYDYTSVVNCYSTNFSRYYDLFIQADNTFHEEFWALYGEDSEEVLYYAEMYADQEESEADSILEEYYSEMNSYYPATGTLNSLYGRLVKAYNKEAKGYGYDNYMEYAYSEVYNREYGPEDTAEMHSFVKEYIAPALVTAHNKNVGVGNSSDRSFFDALSSGRIVSGSASQTATNYIGNYFKWLYDNSDPDKTIDFYSAVEEMFSVGNYFSGSGEGAYTMYVPYGDMACIYVQSGITYDNAFTFVHEFGHYYNYYYNGEKYLSYDHDETHSQGNEMLFLAWLKQNKPSNVTTGMTRLEAEQLENILWTICMASAVDELEQAAYTGVYNGEPFTGTDYHSLFGEILDSYGTDASSILKSNGNQSYWYYVAFDNAVYYISYAMSALPSVELYTIAESEGVEKARETYFKLFTYCDDESRMSQYTYSKTLEYCGLTSPFNESLYTHISEYIDSL